jgi:hypothetical protein
MVSIVARPISMVLMASVIFLTPLLKEVGNTTWVRLSLSLEKVPLNKTQMGNRHTNPQTAHRNPHRSPLHFLCLFIRNLSRSYTFLRRSLNWISVMARIITISTTPSAVARPKPDGVPRYTFRTISITGNSMTCPVPPMLL